MQERIQELEMRFMHQERTIEELNTAVYRQELAIERLERGLVRLEGLLRALVPSINKSADEEEPPPHY